MERTKAHRALGDETSATAEMTQVEETSERLGAQRPRPEPSDGLTRRECEVLVLVADGQSNRQIGDERYISERTVARHLANIFHKIVVTNRTEATLYALEQSRPPTRAYSLYTLDRVQVHAGADGRVGPATALARRTR